MRETQHRENAPGKQGGVFAGWEESMPTRADAPPHRVVGTGQAGRQVFIAAVAVAAAAQQHL